MVPVPVHPRTYAHAYYARELTICALDIAYAIAIARAVPWPASNGKKVLYYKEIAAKTWISLFKGTKLA